MSPPPRYPSARQPRSIKTINRLGQALFETKIRLPSLDPARLAAKAQRRTGLDDYGGDSFRKGLVRLVESLEKEARLSQVGRTVAAHLIVGNLENRLRLIEYRKRRPEIAGRPVERPLFVLGLPRTGTTLLFELLALDPAHRAPLSWEVQSPIPPAREAHLDDDPRIARTDLGLRLIEKLAPGFDAIHLLGARLPQECVALMAPQFQSELFGATFYVPSYRRWLRRQDMRHAYDFHHLFLQHMAVDFMRERWVLKTPAHLPCLEALLERYPDAAIVQTHREPMEVMASLSSLSCTLHGAFSDWVDPHLTGRHELEHFSALLEMGLCARSRLENAGKGGQFFDLHFRDLLDDPIAAVAAIYEHFGFELGPEAERRMRGHLRARPRDAHGTHRYHLEDYGLSATKDGERFEAYRRRFGIAPS